MGGGIPILRPIDQCLAANEVYEIAGILNGTTNFMLTKMAEEGMPFADALALAQELGYAERDPSAVSKGTTAAEKSVFWLRWHLAGMYIHHRCIRRVYPPSPPLMSAMQRPGAA